MDAAEDPSSVSIVSPGVANVPWYACTRSYRGLHE